MNERMPYRVTAVPEGEKFWYVTISGLPPSILGVTQALREKGEQDIEYMARDLVALALEVDEDSFDLEIEIKKSEGEKRRREVKKNLVTGISMASVLLAVTGCSSMTEPWNDAKIEKKDDSPAEVYSMPDGFANFATKCDRHGNRVYTTRTEGGEAMAVVSNDPSCAKR